MDPTEVVKEMSSRRTLAAIVFTDIVDFSAMVQANEVRGLNLAHRDLDLFKKTCTKCEGKVLKSTGDGLLMYFDSAVQAVACALECQQILSDAAKTLPPEDVLKHRIGIHLGDVFVTESDVMGDGVNIAARLQTEAEPGGICISQTVYDVVKNRLAVKATYLGARELKNIQEAVPVYQILLEAQAGGAARRPAMKKKPGGNAGLTWAMIGIAVAVLALAGVVVAVVLTRGNEKTPSVVLNGSSQPVIVQVDAKAVAAEIAKNNPTGAPATAARPEIVIKSVADAKRDGQRRACLSGCEFNKMLEWLKANEPDNRALADKYTRMEKARKVLLTRVTMADEKSPLVIADRAGNSLAIWGNAREVTIKGPDGQRTAMLLTLPAGQIARLFEAVGQGPAAADLREEAKAAGVSAD